MHQNPPTTIPSSVSYIHGPTTRYSSCFTDFVGYIGPYDGEHELEHDLKLTSDEFISTMVKILKENRPDYIISKDGVLEWLVKVESGGGFSTKTDEDSWGKATVSEFTGKPTTHQWTTFLSERATEECLELCRDPVVTRQPVVKNFGRLDMETRNFMIESKTGSYHTSGTAHEKIAGCPYKYAEIPRISGKSLLIVVSGRAETFARKVGQGGGSMIITPRNAHLFSPEKTRMVNEWASVGIRVVPMTRIIGFIRLLSGL